MTMKWVEAHRKLDAGIPIAESEWPAIERSLYWFYGIPTALVLAFAIGVSVWGYSVESERVESFRLACEAQGKRMQQNWYARRCVEQERKAK